MHTRNPTTARCWRLLGVGLLLLPVWLACQPSPPAVELPPGPLVAGDAAALRQLLSSLDPLQATPVAREAARAREAVRGCSEFVASAAGESALWHSGVCVEQLPAELLALRGDAALVFVWPLGVPEAVGPSSEAESEPTLVGQVHVAADGSLRMEARLDRLPVTPWSRWLVPDAEPAGPSRLSSREALIQGRFRPRDGLDLASLVASGSQADRMFRLKSELFAGAALGHAWEFAIYMPRPGSSQPPMALSLDVADRDIVRAGVRHFVEELEATWPLHARAAHFDSAEGACFEELRLMPEFAPCYALGDASLVFGWNATSIELALREAPSADQAAPSRLVADLAGFAEADLRLQLAARSQDEPLTAAIATVALPAVSAAPGGASDGASFARFDLELRPDGESLELIARLERAEPR